MEVAQENRKRTYILLIFIYELQLARCLVQLTHNSTSDTFICGGTTQFTCKMDSTPVLMSWVKDGTSLTDCQGTGSCFDATKENYQFTSDVAVKEFYLTVNPIKLSNAGTFTCSNGASEDDSKTISIAAVPSAITITQESGTGTITLVASTDCAYPMSDVSIVWYYLKELTETPQLYTDTGFSPNSTEDNSTCTSGDCTSGVGVSKVVSTVTFDEKGSGSTSAYLQAKMVHSAVPSSSPAVVATTTNKYIIIEAPTVERYKCPVLGNRIAVDSKAKCGCAWFGIILLILLGVLFLIGLCCGCSLKSASVKEGKSCEDCVNNRYCRCECFASTPCGACCNIKGLPYWYQVLWASVVGSTVAFGIWLAWRPRKNGKGDKASNVVNTGSHPDEKKKQGRPQPPLPGANSNHREGSGSVVTGRDVEMQETYTPLKRSQSPDIHDGKRRGLSANFTDGHHPLVSIDIPAKRAGALESIPDSAREDVTKKKKKRKRRVETEDDQSD